LNELLQQLRTPRRALGAAAVAAAVVAAAVHSHDVVSPLQENAMLCMWSALLLCPFSTHVALAR
jgi:hypothetical protein